jgi:hypothetical protein
MARPPVHQFVVFSILENDVMKQKFVQCNNCGIVHKVVDLCKSEIVDKKEVLVASTTVDDIKVSLSKNICMVLETAQVDLPTWEHALFIVENKLWGDFVVLNSDSDGTSKQGKIVKILGENLLKVETFMRDEVVQ